MQRVCRNSSEQMDEVDVPQRAGREQQPECIIWPLVVVQGEGWLEEVGAGFFWLAGLSPGRRRRAEIFILIIMVLFS